MPRSLKCGTFRPIRVSTDGGYLERRVGRLAVVLAINTVSRRWAAPYRGKGTAGLSPPGLEGGENHRRGMMVLGRDPTAIFWGSRGLGIKSLDDT